MENSGTYHALIEAKRLVLSSPEYVYDYLEKHYEKLPFEVFDTLFKCNNELIKLGLAKFCKDHEILRKLYVESAKEDGEAIRCAVLSNPHCEFSGFLSPFEDDEKKSILENATPSELQAFISNKSLRGSSLTDIFTRTGWADNLTDEQWLLSCVYALHFNPNLKQDYESAAPTGYSEGWEDCEHGKALEAAWQLLENVPLTDKWAINLGRVISYRQLYLPYSCNDEFFHRIFSRWRSDNPELEEHFGDLRMWVGAYVPSSSRLHTWMADHDDQYIRFGHYYSFDTDDPEELEKYYTRDGKEFINIVTSNDNLFRREKIRGKLKEVVDKYCHTRGDWFELDLFEIRLNKLSKENPILLSEEEREEKELSQPVTVGVLIKKLEELENKLTEQLDKKLSKLRKTLF